MSCTCFIEPRLCHLKSLHLRANCLVLTVIYEVRYYVQYQYSFCDDFLEYVSRWLFQFEIQSKYISVLVTIQSYRAYYLIHRGGEYWSNGFVPFTRVFVRKWVQQATPEFELGSPIPCRQAFCYLYIFRFYASESKMNNFP